MADYERAYPVDTGAGSTETNSSAWIKNEQEHARIYRLLNSLAAKLEKALADYESRLSDLESEIVDLRGDMQQEIVTLKQYMQNTLDTTIATIEADIAGIKTYIADIEASRQSKNNSIDSEFTSIQQHIAANAGEQKLYNAYLMYRITWSGSDKDDPLTWNEYKTKYASLVNQT